MQKGTRSRMAVGAFCFVMDDWECAPLPVQNVFAWGRLDAFCKTHRRRGCSLLMAKENQKTTSDFDALDPRTRGYSPLVTPTLLGSIQKIQVAALEDFLCSADSKPPLSRCATAPPRGSGHARKLYALAGNCTVTAEAFPRSGEGGCEWSEQTDEGAEQQRFPAALQMPFPVTTLP